MKTPEEINKEANDQMYDLLSKGDQNIRAQIAQIHEEMRAEHDKMCDKLDAGEVSRDEFASFVNTSLPLSLKKIAAIVGEELVEQVFEIDLNNPIQLVDPALMGK